MTEQTGMLDATPLADAPLPQTEWHGDWPGVVVSTADPLKQGRIQVRVSQVYGDTATEVEFIPDAGLPWALPSFPAHDYNADFEPGDGIIVSFWGGNPAFPVWKGQYLGATDAPAEFVSSYSPTPKTRIMRTSNGHIIELRWKAGEEEIRIRSAGGVRARFIDAPALGGPKFEAETPGGRKATLDDKLQLARIGTPTQYAEMLDATSVININTPGSVNVIAGVNAQVKAGVNATVEATGGLLSLLSGAGLNVAAPGGGPMVGPFTVNTTAAAILNFALALAITAGTTLVLTATAGLATLTGATVAILATVGLVSLGKAGVKQKIVLESAFIPYNTHTHVVSTAPGVTLGPSVPMVIGVDSTINTEAN